jgi:integrase
MNCVERRAYGNQARSNKPIIIRAGNIPGAKIYRSQYRKRLKSGRHRRYDLFRVAYYVAGKRKVEAFGNLHDAKERAGEIARAIAHGRLSVLELTSADRESYINAIERLKPLEIPLHSAIEEYVAARAHLNGEPLLSAVKQHVARRRDVIDKRVSEVVAEFLAIKERDGLSERYVETLRAYLNRLATAFNTNIGSVPARLIDEWLAAQKVGPRSRNNIRTYIVTLFRFARGRGYLPKGLPTEAEDVAKAKDRGGEIGILTPKQLADVFEGADEESELYFALGAFCGLRSSEVIRLEWQDVNFARGHIQVGKTKSKTATRRLVPIQPNLMQWLSPYRRRTGFVFPRKRRFRRARTDQGSERAASRAIAHAKKILGAWPDNALRHSYATYRLAQINDAARIALEMGNSPQMLFRNYRELADERDAAAWFSIAPAPVANVVHMKRAVRACQ